MHAGIAAAPAAPSPPGTEFPLGPGQVVGFVPMVEAGALGLRHLRAYRKKDARHAAPPLSNPDIGVVDREADLQHDLIMLDLAVFEVAARLQHLKPAQVAQGAAGTADRALDRILDAGLRRAADLDDPVDVVFHRFRLLVARMLLCDPRETRPPSH